MMRVLAMLCALLAVGNASACMCERESAGFIHANLQRLPANARGALFQLPPGSAITLQAQAFTIVSDRHAKPLKAELSWPTLGLAHPRLLSARMLARVGPVGGFQPGVRYTITYHGNASGWHHPVRAEFIVDAAPLKVGSYQLVLSDTPARRLLALPGEGSPCSTNQPAIVAAVTYRIPDHYAPYRSAMIYASEIRGADGSSRLAAYSPSICAPWTLDATAKSGGRDLLHTRCEQPGPPATVRGHAGLLEVEDSLQATNDVAVDFRQAPGQACSGGSMLNEAFANDDAARVTELVCAVDREPWYLDDVPHPTLPSPLTLMKLAFLRNPPPKACMAAAWSRWGSEARHRLRHVERFFNPFHIDLDAIMYALATPDAPPPSSTKK